MQTQTEEHRLTETQLSSIPASATCQSKHQQTIKSSKLSISFSQKIQNSTKYAIKILLKSTIGYSSCISNMKNAFHDHNNKISAEAQPSKERHHNHRIKENPLSLYSDCNIGTVAYNAVVKQMAVPRTGARSSRLRGAKSLSGGGAKFEIKHKSLSSKKQLC